MRHVTFAASAVMALAFLAGSASGLPVAKGTVRVRFLSAPNGTVTSRPAGINCRTGVLSAGCQATFAAGARVTLSVEPAAGYVGVWRCETVSKRTDQPGGTTCTVVVKAGRMDTFAILWSKKAAPGGAAAIKDGQFVPSGGHGPTLTVIKGKVVLFNWFRVPCKEGTDVSIAMDLNHPLKTAVPAKVGPFAIHELLAPGAISVGGAADGGQLDITGTFTSSTRAQVHVTYSVTTSLGACTADASFVLTN
jgi:hypothetical protein